MPNPPNKTLRKWSLAAARGEHSTISPEENVSVFFAQDFSASDIGVIRIASSGAVMPGALHEPRRTLDPETFDTLLGQIAESLHTAGRATETLNALNAWTKTLTVAVEHLANAVHRIIVPVNALPRKDLMLRRGPLYVSVEQDAEDEFVAEVVEVGAVGYGDTVAGAVDEVVRSVCDIYDEVASADAQTLGPRPLRWQAALRHLIERANG